MALDLAGAAPKRAHLPQLQAERRTGQHAGARSGGRLSGAGHRVFIDQRLAVGQAWAEEIEKQVRKSDYLIVFLTAESSRSEMVRGEIEIARHHAATAAPAHSAGAPRLRGPAAVSAERVPRQDSVRRVAGRGRHAAAAS